jgi:hypothetical protein
MLTSEKRVEALLSDERSVSPNIFSEHLAAEHLNLLTIKDALASEFEAIGRATMDMN